MWLKARILKKQEGGARRIFVHFTDWDSRWDEWIRPDVDAFRLAPVGFYTGCNTSRADFRVGDRVEVYITRPLPRSWIPAIVRKVHRQQVKVEYHCESRRHEYWFHAKSLEIRHTPSIRPPIVKPGFSARLVPPLPQPSSSSDSLVHQEPEPS